jgi:hypothetical protein
VKNPIPTEIIAKAAKALPPVPVAISNTLHITLENALISASSANAKEELKAIRSTEDKINKDTVLIFILYIVFIKIFS